MSISQGVFDGGEGAPPAKSAAVIEEELGAARRRRMLLIAQIGVGIGILAFWQIASGWLIDGFFISSPDAVAAQLWRWFSSGSIWGNLYQTLYAMVFGFAIGAFIGFCLGLLFGRSETIATIFDPYVTALYCIPKIALAPLFIMWFGIGIESKIAMSATVVFFLVFLNTYSGVRDVNRVFINAARIMGANEWQLMRIVITPSAAAWVLAGLKVSVPYALIGVVVGEFMSSNRGIGYLIAQASGLYNTAGVFAGLVILSVIGATMSAGVKRLERHVLRWRGT